MNHRSLHPSLLLAGMLAALAILAPIRTHAQADDLHSALQQQAAALESALIAEHGEMIRPRLRRGLDQVMALWRPEDGDAEAFASFVRAHFAADPDEREAMFVRLQSAFEQLEGLLLEATRQLRMHVDVEQGPILAFDRLLAAYNPSDHLLSDLFENKLAFVVLLNFPLTTLDERMAQADEWSRREWAEVRLAQRFGRRVPAEANKAASEANAAADAYVSAYNIWMHHLVDDDGRRLFSPGQRLISHWNLRDEIKASYGHTDALARQRMIQQVMERIVAQTIPAVVIDNPRVDWNPFTNAVHASDVVDYDAAAYASRPAAPSDAREPDVRYQHLLAQFHAERLVDPHAPSAPTAIQRVFDEGRELSEERVRAIFEAVLTSPLVGRIARVIETRLGRPLEPFDIWYDGFQAHGGYDEEALNQIVAERYPDAEAFRQDIPRILQALEFDPEVARFVAEHIEVHPSRGAGHAWGGGRRGDPAFLRTRVESAGMDYKGYNIAVHELGHNVEQVLSMNRIDHTLLEGVPNTAFTEALAFVFQERDLELLGLSDDDPLGHALGVLEVFWNTFEIAGVGLVDVDVWHWMYDHPDATPAELREAVVEIAQRVWNQYYAPVFGQEDSPLLGIYSHMISYPLYLANYPLGHLIAFQIQEQMEEAGAVGPEFVRMATLGNILPDLWMEEATGAPVGAEALLVAAEAALEEVERSLR